MEKQDLEKLKEKIRKDMVISADEEFLRLIEKLKEHLKIDKSSGPIISSDVARNLNVSDKIVSYLLALRIAKYLGVFDKESAQIGEIIGKIGTKPNVAGTRIAELIKDNVVVNMTGGVRGKNGDYRLTDYGIEYFKKKILLKLSDNIKK